MHSETSFAYYFCCVSCDSQVVMERFFQTYGLVMGASQSVQKAVQTLPLIFMVLFHLLHLRRHPCSPVLHFQEMLKSFTIYIKCIKCKGNGCQKYIMWLVVKVGGRHSKWDYCITVLSWCHFPLPLQGK